MKKYKGKLIVIYDLGEYDEKDVLDSYKTVNLQEMEKIDKKQIEENPDFINMLPMKEINVKWEKV